MQESKRMKKDYNYNLFKFLCFWIYFFFLRNLIWLRGSRDAYLIKKTLLSHRSRAAKVANKYFYCQSCSNARIKTIEKRLQLQPCQISLFFFYIFFLSMQSDMAEGSQDAHLIEEKLLSHKVRVEKIADKYLGCQSSCCFWWARFWPCTSNGSLSYQNRPKNISSSSLSPKQTSSLHSPRVFTSKNA